MRDLRELRWHPCSEQTVPPLSQENVALVERLAGRPLPESYIAFLHFCNGCYCEANWFGVETPWGKRGYLVAAFYTISAESADTDDSGEVAWQYRHRDPDVPDGIVPVALTPFGDRIYLDLTEQGQGRVLLEQHGLPGWASGKLPANTDLVIYVAESFEAFLDLLTEMPEEDK